MPRLYRFGQLLDSSPIISPAFLSSYRILLHSDTIRRIVYEGAYRLL